MSDIPSISELPPTTGQPEGPSVPKPPEAKPPEQPISLGAQRIIDRINQDRGNQPRQVLEDVAGGSNLVKIGWSKEDNRTEREIAEGMPRFNNEGFLAIELDRQAIVDLLRNEGLTHQQISALSVTFKAARLVDVDIGGDFIGGKTVGPEIEILTSIPLKLHKEETPPEIVKSRFVQYHVAFPQREVVDSLLHELKHYVQYVRGVNMPNSWAVRSQEEHDNLPTEREAIEFATAHTEEFMDKLRVSDEGGHFKPIREVVPEELYVTAPRRIKIDETLVARFIEDTVENNAAYEYFDTYEGMLSEPRIGNAKLAEFVEEGQRLVESRAIAAAELDIILFRLSDKLRVAGDNLGAEAVESGILVGSV